MGFVPTAEREGEPGSGGSPTGRGHGLERIIPDGLAMLRGTLASARSMPARLVGFPSGFDLRTFRGLLRENDYKVSPVYAGRVAAGLLQCITNTNRGVRERRKYGARIAAAQIQPPVFVIGHWRSGTSHLHQLLSLDTQFAYPNNYQVFRPHTFLMDEALVTRLVSRFMPETRPMDNLRISLDSPQEDEVALMFLTGLSPYTGLMFPRNWQRYIQFLTLRDVTPGELVRWKSALVFFLKKLSYKYGKPLILKSPPHTARVRTLLELFPQARFVHIRRDPFTVYQSLRRTADIMGPMLRLQEIQGRNDEETLRVYVEMHDALFEDRLLVPAGQYHELAFEDLDRDPHGEVEKIYRGLNLPGFKQMEPRLVEYLESVKDYQKSSKKPLDPELRERIATTWHRTFEAWGYPL